jgi:cardiolipin synthase A/B
MPSARSVRNAAIVGAAGLAGIYAFEAARYHRSGAKGFDLEDPPSPGTPDFARLVEALTTAPLRQGNRITVLRNGDQIFPAMLAAIQAAERTVDFATYVYWTGSIAPQFADALAERARAGVEVNVLLDAVGAAKMDRALVEQLQAAGATVAWFRPVRWWTLHKLNNRTHRKILVVDGRVGFAGGVGIAEEWTGNCQDASHWRDTPVLRGDRVRSKAAVADHRLLRAAGGVRRHPLRSGRSRGRRPRPRQWSHIDRQAVRQAGRRSYRGLLAGRVRLFEYQRTMLHAKTMLVDSTWATIGSINFDNLVYAQRRAELVAA